MSNYVITISREFGSGGRIIGEAIAKELGIKCYDKNVSRFAAQQSGLSEQFIDNAETDAHKSLLFNLSVGGIAPLQDKVFMAQAQIIKELAQKESCVFVGRCADHILRDHERCLNVFVHAPIEMRIKRAKTVYGINESNMKSYIQKKDRARASYHAMYAENEWGDARSYDLSVNSGMGIELVQRMIVAAAKERFGL